VAARGGSIRCTGFSGTAPPSCRAVSVCAGGSVRSRRTVSRGVQHSGAGAGFAACQHRHLSSSDWSVGRPRFGPRVDRGRPRDGSSGSSAHPRAGLLDARFCHDRADAEERVGTHGRARYHDRGDRHSPVMSADPEGPAPSLCGRATCVRCHVRERAGRRAHLSLVPLGQPASSARSLAPAI
jgi:hypothetical protein